MTPGKDKRIILIVHNPGNAKVLAEAVADIGMTAVNVNSSTALTEYLSAPEMTHAALVDVSGFGQSVWSLCKQLHEYNIPFVVMSPASYRNAGERSLECGASSVIQKPIAKDALLKLLSTLGNQ